MKKILLICLLAGLVLNLSAQKKKVAYCTFTKTMDATATVVTNDPIIQVLKADANLDVTVFATAAAGEAISGLADFDVIVVQESFGSGDAILKPGGSLALATMPKPFVYNKTYALRSGRGLTTSTAAAAESAALNFTVVGSALNHDLFKACTISGSNEINVLAANTNDLGATGTKSLNYTTGNVVSASTLIAQPSGTTTAAIAVNDVPAGTSIDSETLTNRMIAISMNFGSISANQGNNITSDGLTIWRNAVYILAGLPVPSTKAVLPSSVVNPGDYGRIVSVEYFTITGASVREPQKGIYVKKTTFDNGLIKSDKVVFTEEFSR